MNGAPYDGPERRKAMAEMEQRVRMLEELERAGTKSREGMHIQITELKTEVKTGFKEVAEAINDLGIEIQSQKGSCPADDLPCPKADIPWMKQWLTWIGAGEVLLASFTVAWIIQHIAGK